jgi:oligopeptide transport system substrate-binding protein
MRLVLDRRRTVTSILCCALVLVPGGCGGDEEEAAETGAEPAAAVFRMALGSDPPTLDAGLATDVTSFYVIQALMDPLVKLDDDLEPAPALAERWETSEGGKRVTFHLRKDGAWTNGDPVTAHDFEWSWKRAVDPVTAAGYAYQFYGIAGAQEYNSCDAKKADCEPLREKVGVKALDDHTLQVDLTSPQPWFVKQSAHLSFMAVHRASVEKHGDAWTKPANIVTNGPFRLQSWKRDESLVLERWSEWRDAAAVKTARLELRVIKDATTALAAFEAGEIHACIEHASCIPSGEFDRLEDRPEFEEFPALLTSYLGVNVEKVPLKHRRALALALDRRELVDNVIKAGSPAISFTPKGMPGFESIVQSFLPETAALDRAREELGGERIPPVTIYSANDELSRDILVAVQAMWKELGVDAQLKPMEWGSFLSFLGPPPNKAVDVYSIGWIGDFVDDINFLELWTCESGNNFSRYCDPEYDKLIAQARSTPDDAARFALYEQAEAMLTGPEGAFPLIPINWGTSPILRKESVRGLELNLLGQFDWTKVSVAKGA